MQYSMLVEAANPVVLIIGDTVLMDGVEACLRDLHMDNLVHWRAIHARFEEDLKACRPRLIIFERNTPDASVLINLLKDTPGIHLLGIDYECNHVVIMNSFQIQTRSMRDLQRIVQEAAGVKK